MRTHCLEDFELPLSFAKQQWLLQDCDAGLETLLVLASAVPGILDSLQARPSTLQLCNHASDDAWHLFEVHSFSYYAAATNVSATPTGMIRPFRRSSHLTTTLSRWARTTTRIRQPTPFDHRMLSFTSTPCPEICRPGTLDMMTSCGLSRTYLRGS